jgi:hypothetical protein
MSTAGSEQAHYFASAMSKTVELQLFKSIALGYDNCANAV